MKVEDILSAMLKSGQFAGVERFNYTINGNHDAAAELYNLAVAIGGTRTQGFAQDEGLAFAYRNIAKWLAGDKTMQSIDPDTKQVIKGDVNKGIYLAGRTGCGKTWAMEIFGYLARRFRLEFNSDGRPKALGMELFRADDITDDFMREGNLSLYVNTPCVVIDDLGTEPSEVLYMGNRVDAVRQVLEKRADFDDRLTCVTSNLPMHSHAIVERYGDRVASRMNKMFNYIVINGIDRRQ